MFRSILLVGALAATFMLALVSCDSWAGPPTATPTTPTELQTATPAPMPEYLEETIPPCIPPPGSTLDPCGPRENTGVGGGAADEYPIPEGAPTSASEYLAGSSAWVPHIIVRGTFLPNTVRCDARYTFVRPAYTGEPVGGPDVPWTWDGDPILHCFQDVRVNEYIVGSGPPTLTLQVSHAMAFPKAKTRESLDAFENVWERALTEGGHTIPREPGVGSLPLLDGIELGFLGWESFTGIEFIMFVGPSQNANLQAWNFITWWNIEEKDDGTVIAVHPERDYFPMEGNESVLEMTLPAFKQEMVAAQATRVTANGGRIQPGSKYPMLITDANNLRQFFVEIGSYDDPANPPGQPIAAYECDNTTAVTSPGINRGLVQDCESLLDSKEILRGTGSLNWSARTAVTGWDGVTVTDDRIVKVDLDDESLTGTISAAIGNLPALTHLDLSDNSLTGIIPPELADLDNLQVLRLSGNSLTGCIPADLKNVPTNDLNSLNLLDCPAAPSNPSLGTPGEASVPLTWTGVTNAAKYRVEYRVGSRGEWALDYRDGWTLAEVPTGTSYTVTGLVCQNDYRVRVRAYGNGSTYAAEWSDPSESATTKTTACVAPTFGSASYSFSVRDNAEAEGVVGTVTATGSLGADNAVTYSVTEGNEDGKFAIGSATGEITVAAALTGLAGTTYTLTVEAEDESGGAATVTVTITVENT